MPKSARRLQEEAQDRLSTRKRIGADAAEKNKNGLISETNGDIYSRENPNTFFVYNQKKKTTTICEYVYIYIISIGK